MRNFCNKILLFGKFLLSSNRVLFLFVLYCLSCSGKPQRNDQVINVMFYNTENLFDINDNPDKDDDEFTPDGARRWTEKRYWNKLTNLSRVLVAVDEADAPEIVGLCEVENDSVLRDLTTRSVLKSIGYRYVVTDSPDIRGINVALLYKSSWMRLIASESLRVDLSDAGGKKTRDILHVTGRISSGDTLDIYVCHWPSRIGGIEASEPFRRIAAQVAMTSVRNVLLRRAKPYIILMGDLNEGCSDPAVRMTMGSRPLYTGASLPDDRLVTLMDGQAGGSYRYEGRWELYDQFVVSASFLNGHGNLRIDNIRICSLNFLLEDDVRYGGRKPLRTYNGYRYQNGFSDHLPIAFDICY